MMKVFFYLIFLFPLFFSSYWWLFCFGLIFGFIFFLNVFSFNSYYSMISYSFGGDVLSLSMVFLSFWIVFLMFIASYSIYASKSYFFDFAFMTLLLLLFLVLSFTTSNIFLFYLFFESSLIPTLFLIFGWGYQPERLSAGFYLLFYTLFASLPLLLCIFYIGSFSFTCIYFLISLDCNFYIYISLLLAFLVSMPMFFIHFWLPSAHVEAPISGSMILAGVLLKLGGYGLLRVFFFIYSYSVYYNFVWIGLSLYGSVLVGVLCLYQVDIKLLIAYSSVAHMGLVLCGLMSLNYWGLCGALILMIGHGLCSSGLFCLANILYESTHSRSLLVNKGMLVFMPSMSLFWFLLSSNNMASPPSLNLLGELMLINSLMGWGSFSFLFLGLSSFLCCCYSIYMFSYTQHGLFYGGLSSFLCCSLREYYLVIFHFIPLNILFLSADIFVLWL